MYYVVIARWLLLWIAGDMRLTHPLLARYFQRYIERELTHENLRRQWKLFIGWKEHIRKNWNYDEHRPWTQAFKDNNKACTRPKRVFVEPIKEWHIFKGDRVSVLCRCSLWIFLCIYWWALKLLGRLPNFGSRPNTMGGKFPSVRMSVCPYVCPSTKSFFDFDEIWYTGSTWWEMKKGNDHARIQGQGQGQEPTKVGNLTILDHFQTLSPPPFIMGLTNDHRFLN